MFEVNGMNFLNRTSLISENGIPYFENPELRRLGWIKHAFLTRQGGMSLPPYDSLNLSFSDGDDQRVVLWNRDRIAEGFGFDPNRLILLQQMQLDGILILKDPVEVSATSLKYDAIITSLPNQFLGILTADCIPILIVDQKRKIIAAIHAGRQGTSLQITRKTLRRMKEKIGLFWRRPLGYLGSIHRPLLL